MGVSIALFKVIWLDSMRSSHVPFKMYKVGYVRSSLPTIMHVGSVATPFLNAFQTITEDNHKRFDKRAVKK